ncbi:uncharacterized protein K02A2.6-like [Eupeodes corollae]|uniref:uncharacterized protein K02A2.6-like n=1 Tax=Eupeodes corollae TaxID=290404 RepID=UPI00249376F4|nr:uncharacterized protein K02A2.6-like [Eupeodes corollae]
MSNEEKSVVQTIAVGNNFEEFNPESVDWEVFEAKLQQYFLSVGEEDEQRKTAFLLTKLHHETFKLLRDSVYPKTINKLTFAEVTNNLTNFYGKKVAVFVERRSFYDLKQMVSESINEWYTRIKKSAVNCKFGNQLDAALRDIFITGLKDGPILDKLLEEDETITLDKAWQLAIKKETLVNSRNTNTLMVNKMNTHTRSSHNDRSMKSRTTKSYDHTSAGTSATGNNKGMRNVDRTRKNDGCHRCGRVGHNSEQCYYKSYVCDICKIRGHLKIMCRNKNSRCEQIKHISAVEGAQEKDDDEYIELKNITANTKIIPPITLPVKIDGCQINMELDTGSAVTIIPQCVMSELFATKKLMSSNLKVKGYGGEEIKVYGKIECECEYQGKNKKLEVYITEPGRSALLGRDFATEFGLILSLRNSIEVHKVTKSIESKIGELETKFANVFDNKMGKFKHEKINLKMKNETVSPVFIKPRNLPYALKENVEKEIDRLTAEGILTPVEYNKWGTPLVPVIKSDGRIRLCGDYKSTINKYLEVDTYPLPRIQDLLHKLSGGEKYSKIDLKEAYLQIELDEESKKLCAWSTSKGVYLVNRMPYGISPATSKFQRIMAKMFHDIENVTVFVDDILVTGKNDDEHITNLERVFQRLQDAGMTVKLSKCEFFKEEICYLGQIINKTGIRKNPGVKAVLKADPPRNVKQVQAFSGLVNYYGRYIPNVSMVMAPIYNLLKLGASFVWTKECQAAFDEIKSIIASDKVLVHYHPEWEVVLECDASDEGIAAALSHKLPSGEERPISFASRILSSPERNYSVLDKEALAVYYGVQKFSDYLFGRQFIIRSDHKPLLAKYGEDRSIPLMAAKRVHRWATYLAAFNYKFEYIKGQDNKVADMLSRFSFKDEVDTREQAVEEHIKKVITEVKLIDFGIIQELTQKDRVLTEVLKNIKTGWKTKNMGDDLKPYWLRRNELEIINGVVMWGFRVLVPEQLQSQVLEELHDAHLGMSKTKSLARSYVWWPHLDMCIEKMVRSCLACGIHNANPPKAAINQWPEATEPWERIHADFAGPFLNRQFLVIVDAKTKWVEIYPMNSIVAKSTIEKFYETFARFGLPRTLVTDNGTTFTGSEFQSFIKKNGIKHITSPPGHPQSNGLAENAVKSFKLAVKKILAGGEKSVAIALARYLFHHRLAEHTTTGLSPALEMFKRRLRMRLDLLRSEVDGGVKTLTNYEDKPIQRDRKMFVEGEPALVKDFRIGKRWSVAVVKKKIGKQTYLVTTDDNHVWKRHLNQMKKFSEKTISKTEAKSEQRNTHLDHVVVRSQATRYKPTLRQYELRRRSRLNKPRRYPN